MLLHHLAALDNVTGGIDILKVCGQCDLAVALHSHDIQREAVDSQYAVKAIHEGSALKGEAHIRRAAIHLDTRQGKGDVGIGGGGTIFEVLAGMGNFRTFLNAIGSTSLEFNLVNIVSSGNSNGGPISKCYL